jgi:hypothetical protein
MRSRLPSEVKNKSWKIQGVLLSDMSEEEVRDLIDTDEEVDTVKDRNCCFGMSIGLFNTFWCGVCFLGLFSCFNPVQALQSSTLRNGYGFIGVVKKLIFVFFLFLFLLLFFYPKCHLARVFCMGASVSPPC